MDLLNKNVVLKRHFYSILTLIFLNIYERLVAFRLFLAYKVEVFSGHLFRLFNLPALGLTNLLSLI